MVRISMSTMIGIRQGAMLLRYNPDGTTETIEWTGRTTSVRILTKSENFYDETFNFIVDGIEYAISYGDALKTGDGFNPDEL
jgi:hypothetical protein